MLRHKTSFSEFKKIEVISGIFSNHNGTKLENNHKKKTDSTHTCGEMPGTKQGVSNRVSEEIKSYFETNDYEHTTTQNLWNTEKAVLRGKFIAIRPTPRIKKNLK